MASIEIKNFILKHKKGLAAVALLGGIIASHFDKDPIKEETTKYTAKEIMQECGLSGESQYMTDKIMTGKVYIHNEKRKATFKIIFKSGPGMNWHAIVDSKNAYLWSGKYLGQKYPLFKERREDVFFDKKIETSNGKFTHIKVSLNLECQDWEPDNSVFKIPDHISFWNPSGRPDTPEQRAIIFCLANPNSCSSKPW